MRLDFAYIHQQFERFKMPLIFVGVALLALMLFGWLSRGFVRAYVDVKTVHVFATTATARGWQAPDHVLSLDLPADAPYPSFTRENSAYVSIGTTTEPAASASGANAPAVSAGGGGATSPSGTGVDESVPTEGAAASSNGQAQVSGETDATSSDMGPDTVPATGTPVETAPSDAPVPDAAAPAPDPTPAPAPAEPAPSPAPAADPAPAPSEPTSLLDTVRSALAGFVKAGVAFATSTATSSDASSTADATAPITTTASTTEIAAPEPPQDVAVCVVLNTPCYTVELSGFSVSGTLTDKKFKGVSVNLSFASLAPIDAAQDDTLVVRFYHAGAWKQAGQLFLNKELSNASNGDYFTSDLPGLTAWDDLSDVRIMIEYERADSDAPARLYLDAAWLEVKYQERAQDVLLTGDAPQPSDVPGNVAFDLATSETDKAHFLVFDSGATISFGFSDTASPGTLALRTDKVAYLPGAETGSATAFVSITNTGESGGSFTLASALSGTSHLTALAQYMKNVPEVATTNRYGSVTYFCDGGWQAATTTGDFVCAISGETKQCTSLSDTDDNCTVDHVPVDAAQTTEYARAWVDVPLSHATSSLRRSALPTGYSYDALSDQTIEILPGQTIYLRLTMESADRTAIRFILALTGDFSAALDSSKLREESALMAGKGRQARETAPMKRPHLNEQLSEGNEFEANAQPRFHFRFRSQRSFFTRMRDVIVDRTVPFSVTSATLARPDGEEERAPVGISYGDNGDWTLSVDKPPRAFRPGKYTVELTMGEGDAAYSDSVDFYWGVLAVNTDKQPYAPGDTAHLSLAALDDTGDTLCDAKLALTITTPSGDDTAVPVSPGGACGKNNVTDIPDYVADYPVPEDGTYQILLERLDDSGAVIASTQDSFIADSTSTLSIARVGPTRIYPPSAYTMHLTVEARHAFQGTLKEAVPEGFDIRDAGGATVIRENGAQYLSWPVSLGDGATTSVSYQFKAPDVSPYLFLLGSATLSSTAGVALDEGRTWKIASDAVAIATGVAWFTGTTTTVSAELNNGSPTALSWNRSAEYDTTYFSYSSSTPSQLTINQDGDYYIALTLPAERTDTGTRDTRVAAEVYVNGAPQPFAIARSALMVNASNQNESSDHLAVLLRNLHAGDYVEVYAYSPDTVNTNDHMIISGAASLYAEYIDVAQNVYFGVGTTTSSGTDLNTTSTSTMYWYDDATGRKDSNFTHSNSSAPGEITLAAAGYYLVDVNIPLSGAVADANVRGRLLLNNTMVAGGDFKQGSISNTNGDAASSIHFSGVVYATTTNEKLTATVLREGAAGTLNVGSYQASIYVQQLPSSAIYAARTKALTGGTNWNVTPKQAASWTTDDLKDTNYFTHSTSSSAQNITVTSAGDYLLVYNDSRAAAVSRPNQIITVEVNGTSITGAQTKTHFFENASGNTESSGSLTFLLRNLAANDVVTVSSVLEANTGTVPSDQDAILMLWHKTAQSSYIQDTERWYANTNAQTPTDPWPSGATDLNEGDPITSGVSVKSGEVLRLRMAMRANVTTSGGVDAFKLQYAAGSTCSAALSWTDVGAAGSGSIWRGYDNAGVSAGSTITTQLLSVSSTSETYEEQNPSTAAPNAITAGKDGEWDWTLQENGAALGTDYCFRMVHSSGQLLKDYYDYPQLTTNGTPTAPSLSAPFDNEKTASTTPWFEFVSADPNGEDIHYQVQISTDPNFGSTVIDKDSVTSFAQFTNIVTTSDKAPFNSGETVRFAPTTALSNNTTYWWRVRAKDTAGTNTWSSWSSSRSLTVDTSLTVSTWYQTTDAQFDTDTLTNLATSSNTLVLSGSNTSGSVYSPEIDYDWKTTGNAWGNVSWTDTEVGGTLLYQVEYYASTSAWTLIPNSDLAGNSTGTTTSPINLSNLDPTTYSKLRIKANFSKSSASPVLSDWTVSWALTVSAPDQYALFDNEKTSTTTPTFTFMSTDPQADDLVYQIQWSTDSTFATGVSSSTSDTGGSAFWNTSSSTDTSPFSQGNTVSFKIPVGSALTNGNTYWWRVRAKDPSGGNAYSQWSSSRSFTVDTAVTVSTWFQTTTAQFQTDSIHKALASGNAVTVSSDTGKIAIYREATAADNITTAAFFQNFDTVVRQDDIYSMSASTSVRLKQGHYAAFYGTRFGSTGGTRRSEIQSYLNMASTSLPIGWSQGFITRASSANTAFTSGGGIIYAPADDTPLTVMTYRTDTNPTATLSRTANSSGLMLLRLDDNWDYVRLSKTAKQTGPTSATWITVTYDREDELDDGSFSHAQGSGNIVLANPGHYLVFANTYGTLPTASTVETQVKQRLALDGAEIDGSYATVYMRGNTNTNGAYQGAVATAMIIQSTTTNQVLTVQLARAMGTAAWTINADPAGTYVDRTGITIVKLPEGDFIRLRDSGTGNMNPASITGFTWNTEDEKDASFTHSTVTNASRITTNVAGDYLFFGGLYAQVAGVTGGVYREGWRKNGGTELQYGQSGNLSVNTTTADDGNWAGVIFPSMVNTDYVELTTQASGAAGTMSADKKGVQGVRIASLSEADTDTPTVESPDIDFSDGSGPKWSTVSRSATTPGSSSIIVQVLYASSTAAEGYALVPDADLAGNSTGTTSASFSIAGLSRLTYPTLRLRATLDCVSGSCPTLNDWTLTWSAGINISGTAKQFDQSTNVTSGTVAVAVNGVLQAGKTGTISGSGTWSIANVTAFTGDIITVFVQSAATTSRAVAVTKYATDGDITGMRLYQQHLTLGSDDHSLLTNADIGQYDNSVAGTNDVFDDVSTGNTLTVCAIFSVNGCYNARLLVLSGTTYRPDSASGGAVVTRNFQNDGVFIADGNAITVANSWKNGGNFVAGTSGITFSATSTTETIDSTGATSTAFSTVTFGSGSGTATWNLASAFYASSSVSINYGTFSQNGAHAVNLSGSLSIGASGGFTKGSASTTFMGSGSSTWTDSTVAKQDLGTVVIDGTAKTVSMGSGVKATDVTIGTDDILSAGSNYSITVLGNWTNAGSFTAQSGTVTFAATSAGKIIDPGSSSFYDLTFNGVGGNWAFATSTMTVSDNFTIATGTVTLASATTTVGGSFLNTGGTFTHNNGVIYLTTSGSRSVQANGSNFYDLTFNGSGSWGFADTNATSSRHVTITSGTVTAPSGTFAIGGSFFRNGGTFTHNSGTLRFYASNAQIVKLAGTSANNLTFDGSGGSWSFGSSVATTTGTVRFDHGAVTLPTGSLAVGGSFIVTGGSFVSGTSLVRFVSSATGNTIDPGSSTFYDAEWNSTTGGWTVSGSATTTHNATIANASGFTLSSGRTLEVDGTFSNLVGGASTTWSGSTLYLNSGTSYTLDTKALGGDAYGTLALGGATKVKMWNSSATTATVPSTASLYSMNHAGVSGSLYIYGTYANTGDEYWAYAYDFDGTALGGSSRAASVKVASGASVTVSSGTWRLVGAAGATTTIDNQGSGSFALALSGGTLNAQYYSIRNMNSSGFQFSGTPTVSSLSDGDIELAANAGSTMTIASTVIDQNPALQILRMRIATTTAIGGYNVTETGTPSSYWWFRNHVGNLAGEDHDSDPGGNPGSIRWDDSGYDIAVSGHVYADHGSSAIGNPPCDGSTQAVKLVVGRSTSYTASCDGSGAFSFPHVQFVGDVTLTTYLDTNGGKRAVTVTRTPTANITNLDLYQNAVIVRNEDVNALAIANLAWYDTTRDSDIPYTAATSTTDTLTVAPDTELYVWGGKSFTPNGTIALTSGGSGSLLDGRLYLAPSATLTASGTESYAIGGSLYVGTSSTFSTASSTITFAATTTGKTIYSAVPLSFYDLSFSGSGGAWAHVSMGVATTTVSHALALSAGTLSGTGNLVVQQGDLAGSGTVAMTGGTVELDGTGSLGNSAAWQFYDLSIASSASTTKSGTGTTTVSHVLTVGASAKLSAGSAPWILSAGGTPFVLGGTFYGASAPFYYTSTSATNIADASYSTLYLAPSAAGSPTYTILGGTLSADALIVGDGTNAVSVTANTNDPALSIGDLTIRSGATLVGSNVGAFDVLGSWVNGGTFTHSNGAVRFTSTATGKSITTGGSSFYDLTLDSTTGGWTMTDNATTTHDFTLTNASSFTKSSGTSLAVQGTFTNSVGGAATTWTGSTLFLTSGTSYSANTKSVSGDTYGTLLLGPSTNVRIWNSGASSVIVPSNASLYSMNHGGSSGALNIYGTYTRSTGSDYWSYATDFDGADISGSPRAVSVAIASSSSVTLSGGLLDIIGSSAATTTIDNQGSGFYSLGVSGGTFNANYYSIRHTDGNGLNISGTPTIASLSYGDYELSYPGGTSLKVAGTAITANPLKISLSDRFATSTGITSGYNVTATGSTGSSWKFNLHYGNHAGEAYDSDPDGDPGYIRWDDSASAITIAGTVYSDDGSTVDAAVCDSSTQSIRLKVEGAGTYTSSCNGSGAYAIVGVTFNPGDTLTVFIDNVSGHRGATVSVDPVSNIGDMDIYENRVIVRHEDTSPLTITAMSQYDSSNDSDIPFRAIVGSPNTLTVQPNTKLVVWTGKTFAPAGNVTLSSGNGNAWDGTLQLKNGATFSAAGTQSHSIGGSVVLGTGASIVPANATFTFAATTTGKTLDFGGSGVYNATFNGSGGNWAFSTSTAAIGNNFTITAGSVTLPTATTTIGGSFVDSGSFAHNNGTVVFTSTAAGKTVTAGGSNFYNLTFDGSGGSWSFSDTNATSSGTTLIAHGSVTLPSGVFAVGSSFVSAGTFTSGSGTLRLTSAATGKTITTGGSNLSNVVFDGAGGAWTWTDSSATTTNSFQILNGSTTLPTTQLAVGGSFTNAGTFTAGSGRVKLTSTATGKSITTGGSSFYDLTLDSTTGGWTMTDNATTTHDFTLTNASSFTKSSGTSLAVQGTFTNSVGGAATTWTGSTLFLTSGTSYSANTKSVSGDTYGTLLLGPSTNVRIWNSGASSVIVPSNASLYSMNHGGSSGALNIYGTYTRSTGSDYWSYATDFDGAALGGSSRQVSVQIASSSVITYQSGSTLNAIGTASATTTIANQGSNFYSFAITGGTLNAQYYSIRNTDASGLSISGSPTITSLANGDFEVSYPGGSAITVAGSAIDANASAVYTGMRFATSTSITAYNVTRTGSPTAAWSFQSYIGNLSGEAHDVDGGDECGNVRWSDSTCLFVSQEHFRFRNDDGGVGAPDTEWYDGSWSKRKTVVISNPNATSYTDVPVKLVVDYDSDMRSDFGDLRFTDSTGTTSISYWKESYISSGSTTVWVKVPSLPASGSATIYMYYGNSGATGSDSGSGTFRFLEDFESGSLSGYSGDTSLFHVGTSFAHNHTYGLDAGSNVLQQTTHGLYKTGSQTAQGSTIRYYQYVDSSQQDEPCTFFGVQGQGQNYAVCLDEYPVQALEIVKDVTSNDGSGTELASTTVTFSTGWYQVVIDWLTSHAINVTVYDSTGAVFATLSTSDSTYSSGGVGFGFWAQHGGWDFYSVRQYMASPPTYSLGSEQVSGGASWAAAEDTMLADVSQNANLRLRFSIQNTGATLTNRNFKLQVAPLGASLNCESVPYVNYSDVPTDTSGCGSAVACMKTTSHFSNATSIADLLAFPSSLAFVAGYGVADPSNQTSAITVPSYGATEAEYNFQFTNNATGNAYCLRTTDSGASLDNYQHVAEVILLHPPVISNLSLNLDNPIALTEGATTTVYASSTISDDNGYQDIVTATSSIFRSGVGALCSPDENDCYQIGASSCVYSNCSGTSCTLQCRADLQYIADPTDSGSAHDAEDWRARLFLEDSTGLTALATSSGVDLLTLYGLRIDTPSIDFGSLYVGEDTGAVNAQTTFANTGNTPIGIQVLGTDLAGSAGSIPVGEQKYATTTFTYGSCSVCQFLTGSATNVDVSLAKPTATTTAVSGDIFWGLNVPSGTDASIHSGTNTFLATSP